MTVGDPLGAIRLHSVGWAAPGGFKVCAVAEVSEVLRTLIETAGKRGLNPKDALLIGLDEVAAGIVGWTAET